MASRIAARPIDGAPQECGRCHCHTRNGYAVRTRQGNVESLLFVCRSCYDLYYRAAALPDEADSRVFPQRTRPRRTAAGAGLRRAAALVNRGVRSVRRVFVLILLVLMAAFLVKEQPMLRTEIPPPAVHCTLCDLHNLKNRWEGVITHGGEWR